MNKNNMKYRKNITVLISLTVCQLMHAQDQSSYTPLSAATENRYTLPKKSAPKTTFIYYQFEDSRNDTELLALIKQPVFDKRSCCEQNFPCTFKMIQCLFPCFR